MAHHSKLGSPSQAGSSLTDGVVWCIQTSKPDGWSPVWVCDNEKLEAAYHNRARHDDVMIENTFYTAHFSSREVTAAYTQQPPRALRRTLWYFVSNGKNIPFEEDVSAIIEQWKNEGEFEEVDLKSDAKLKISIGEVFGEGTGDYSVLVSRAIKVIKEKVSLKNNENSDTITEMERKEVTVTFSMTKSNEYLAPFASSFTVQRGMPITETEEEKRTKMGHAKALAFVIHGIGEAMFSSDGSIMPSLRVVVKKMHSLTTEYTLEATAAAAEAEKKALEEAMAKAAKTGTGVAAATGAAAADQSYIPTSLLSKTCNGNKLVDLIPIEWHGVVHGEEYDITKQMKTITCSTVPTIREFGNSAIMDLLMYQVPEFQKRITCEAVKKMNAVYAAYSERNPTQFDGKCTIIAHSLGSVITFDILSMQERPPTVGTDSSSSNGGVGGSQVKSFHDKGAAVTAAEDPEEMCFSPRKKNSSGQFIPASDPSRFLFEQQGYFVTSPPTCEQMAKERAGELSKQQLMFHPHAFIALGSPVGMFYTLRSKGSLLSSRYTFPTCSRVYNVFHPLDPVAYRWEPMFHPKYQDVEPHVVDHHAGMRAKYKLKQIGTDIKRGVESWNNLPNKISSDFNKSLSSVSNMISMSIGWSKANEIKRSDSSSSSSAAAALKDKDSNPAKPAKPIKPAAAKAVAGAGAGAGAGQYGQVLSVTPPTEASMQKPSAPLVVSEGSSARNPIDLTTLTRSSTDTSADYGTAATTTPIASSDNTASFSSQQQQQQPLAVAVPVHEDNNFNNGYESGSSRRRRSLSSEGTPYALSVSPPPTPGTLIATDFEAMEEAMNTDAPLLHVKLNGGYRIDYSLQETLFESSNEYLGALTSHSSYFENKDVARFIVDKINEL